MKAIRNSLVLLLVFPIFLFGWLPLSDMSSVHAAESIQLIFTPVADAYVNQSAPSTNYGRATQLRIDGSPLVNSYLRFNISGLDGRVISRAVFQIYANSNLNGGYQIHPVSENAWAETTINYLNAPPMGDSLAASETISSGHWIQADITPILTGEGQLSLALTDSTVTAVSLASRETKTNAPQLIVTLIDSAGPSDTPSPTAADPSDTAIPTPTITSSATFTPTPTFIQQPNIHIYPNPDLHPNIHLYPKPNTFPFIYSGIYPNPRL